MSRWLRALLFVAAGFVLILLLAVALLPRLAESDAVRDQLMSAGREATGRDIHIGELGVRLFPPSLRVREASVAGAQEGDPAFLEGASIDLRLSLLSILTLAPVVDSLVVEGATLRLVRTEDGLILPGPEQAAGESDDSPQPTEDGDASAQDDGGSVDLAIRRIELRGTQVLFEDRTLQPTFEVGLVDIDAEATGELLASRLVFQLAGKLSTGGALNLQGRVEGEGEISVETKLAEIALAPFAGYAPESVGRWAGSLSGDVRGTRPADGADRLEFDLELSQGDLQIDDISMSGSLRATAELEGVADGAAGDFDIDATAAELRYGEFFTKPPGTPARATGKLRSDDGAVQVEETRLKIASAEADTSARVGDSIELHVSAKPFPLRPLLALLPEYADEAIDGQLSFDDFRVSQGDTLAFGGAAEVHALRIEVPDLPPMTVAGVWKGSGDGLIGEPLSVEVAGQSLPLRVELKDLAGEPRLAVQGKAEDLDSRALMAAFAGQENTLEGPLDLDIDLATSLAEDPVAALRGRLGFNIQPGRLRGVSLLESSMGQIGGLGKAALAVGEERGGRSLKRLYGDEFEVLSGTFHLEQGRARTRDLHLVYREYEVALVGDITLANLGLDMKGTLTLGEEAEETLGENATPTKSVIPIAHVGGTIDDPKVRIDAKDALGLARAARPEQVKELTDEIDERLGEGSGKQILDALEGFLGGGRRR